MSNTIMDTSAITIGINNIFLLKQQGRKIEVNGVSVYLGSISEAENLYNEIRGNMKHTVNVNTK